VRRWRRRLCVVLVLAVIVHLRCSTALQSRALRYNMVRCVATCCAVLQLGARSCSMLYCHAVQYAVLTHMLVVELVRQNFTLLRRFEKHLEGIRLRTSVGLALSK
jgi:hypothetical protein